MSRPSLAAADIAALGQIGVGVQAEDWPEPGELNAIADTAPYPVEALPPAAQAAVVEYQRFGGQPMALVASSAIGQMSLAAQALADVARNEHLISPCSVNLMVLAESGERKSAADRIFGRAARAWAERERELGLPEYRRAAAMEKDWRARMDGVKKQITAKAAKDNDEDRAELARLRDRLIELEQNPIVAAPLPALAYEDVTPAGLAKAIARGWPSAGLFSDEGGAVVGGHGMGEDTATALLALLNILWDGRDYASTRKQVEGVEIRGRRFCAFLMLQPDLLPKLIERGARNVGFIARFLLSAPQSTMGLRLYSDPPERWSAMEDFDAHIARLLAHKLPVNAAGEDRGFLMRLAPPVMHLSPEAKAAFVPYHDGVERELSEFGEFSTVKDVAAKSAENAVRLAGIFKLFDQGGPTREIEGRYMEAGIAVAYWHLAEARRLFWEVEAPQNLADARELSRWITGKARELADSNGEPIIDKNGEMALREIGRWGPGRTRDTLRRDAALDVLEEAGHLRRIESGRQKRARINPKLLTPR